MSCVNLSPLGSIAAIRPVFLIVMGVFLMIIAWRLAKNTEGWTARLLVAGALLLGFGYSVLLPMYEAGRIESFSPEGHYHGSPSAALAWHAVKLVSMNTGWLLFGLGLALHARIFSSPTPRSNPALPPAATHEFTT